MCIGLVMFPEHSYFANESIFPLFMAVSSRDGRRMGIRAPHRCTAPTPSPQRGADGSRPLLPDAPPSLRHTARAYGIRTLNREEGARFGRTIIKIEGLS